MSQPKQLFELQLLDSKTDNALARLGEIEIALNDSSVLIKAETQASTAEKKFNRAQKDQKSAGQEVETQQTKISNNEKVTYSGSVTNPKELEDLQLEAEALKRHLLVLEDKLLETMVAFEEAEKVHKQAQTNLEITRSKVSAEKSSLTEEQINLRGFVEEKNAERAAFVAGLDAESIGIYEKLRASKNGIAVAQVVDKSCAACGVNLTPAQAQAARSPNKITTCTSCRRILYSG
ncbi:MAG: hypothetical protein ABFS17_03225 [Chloroflexota bacterium]